MKRLRPSRAAVLSLLAAALFVRAFLPQGTMPERLESGALAVALCGSDGVHLIPLKRAQDGPEQDLPEQDRRAEPPCAFAGLSAPATPPPALAALPVPAAVLRESPVLAADGERAVPARLFPPARAPPLPA